MSRNRIKPWLIAAGAVLVATGALASDQGSGNDQALKQELAQAREQLESAAERVADLSRQLGAEAGPVIIRRFEHAGGPSKRPMLGVVLGGDEQRGVRLQAVTPEGPAARAGLESGDVVTAINGQAIAGADARSRLNDARERLADLGDGQVVQLDFERDGHPGRADVTAKPIGAQVFIGGLASRAGIDGLNIDLKRLDIDVEKIRADVERSLGEANLGRLSMIAPMLSESLRFDAWRWQRLRLAEIDEDLGRYFGTREGVLVLKPEGEDAVLRSGDVILTVAGEAVGSAGEVMRKLADTEPGQPVALSIMRDRSRRDVTLTAPERPNLFEQFGAPPPAPPAPPAPPSAPDRAPPPPPPPAAPVMV